MGEIQSLGDAIGPAGPSLVAFLLPLPLVSMCCRWDPGYKGMWEGFDRLRSWCVILCVACSPDKPKRSHDLVLLEVLWEKATGLARG